MNIQLQKGMVLLSLLVIVLASGCTNTESSPGQGNDNPDLGYPYNMDFNLTASLEELAPSSWTTFAINGSGHTEVTRFIGNHKSWERGRISHTDMALLRTKAESGFFVLGDSYSDMSVDNGTTYIMAISLNNQSNRVICYESCPEPFTELKDMIVGMLA
jgi:hypothetical protein